MLGYECGEVSLYSNLTVGIQLVGSKTHRQYVQIVIYRVVHSHKALAVFAVTSQIACIETASLLLHITDESFKRHLEIADFTVVCVRPYIQSDIGK